MKCLEKLSNLASSEINLPVSMIICLVLSGCVSVTSTKPTTNLPRETYCTVHQPFKWREGDTEKTIDNITRDNFKYDCLCLPPDQKPEECSYARPQPVENLHHSSNTTISQRSERQTTVLKSGCQPAPRNMCS